MRKIILALFSLGLGIISCANAEVKKTSGDKSNTMQSITLNEPDLNRGVSIMQALEKRQSTRNFSDKELSLQDLSDLLWAANGINRPESGKRTAPSAMNRQDVKVYVCTDKGAYLYNHQKQTLDPVSSEDIRPASAPVCLILVSDTNNNWSAIDAGIVSQNISLFCSGTGLATYPRGNMNKDALHKALGLTGEQTVMLCHPVGYFAR